MGRAFLNHEMVTQIKARIWEGEVFRTIGDDFLVSGTTISYIASGKMYHDTPWPDGSVGELSWDRITEIKRARKLNLSGQSTRAFTQHPIVTNEVRRGIVERLNAKEIEVDEVQPTDWDEIILILGANHRLVRQGNRDVFLQETICKLTSAIVVGQRSKEVIEKVYQQELKRKELERKKQP